MTEKENVCRRRDTLLNNRGLVEDVGAGDIVALSHCEGAESCTLRILRMLLLASREKRAHWRVLWISQHFVLGRRYPMLRICGLRG